jgi:glycosyltransferase involved in cell wall biosynthesis
MHILYLNHNVKGRSTYHRCFQFAKHLVTHGHHVDLLTIAPTARLHFRETVNEGVHIIETPDLLVGMTRTGWDPYDTWRRQNFLKGRHYDLIHAFDCRPAVILPALAQRKRDGATLLTDWADWWGRGGVIDERPNKLIKFAFEGIETYFEEHYRTQANGLTVISDALHKRALSLGVRPERIAHLSGGADIEHITPRDRIAARRALGIPEHGPIVGFSGFVHYDLALLLEAFDELVRLRPDTRLLLTGARSPLVKRYARQGGWEDRVIEAGVIDYAILPQYHACVDVFALPYADKLANRGRWPNKIGDYLAAGRPIVSNPVGDIKILFTSFDIGYLTDETPSAFAQGLLRAIENPEASARKGQIARSVAEKVLSWQLLSVRLEEHYYRIQNMRRDLSGEGDMTLPRIAVVNAPRATPDRWR